MDHFIAKSSALSQAYEWSNYRLACSKMNTRKNKFDDVLDPFSVASDSFRIDFLTGEILINLPINTPEWDIADKTIKRLGLDDQDCRDERVEYFNDYISGEIGSARLKKEAPFVWLEMERQQLL